MHLKLIDEHIECEQVFGPMSNLNTTFETYFIEKAYNLLYKNSKELKYVVSRSNLNKCFE